MSDNTKTTTGYADFIPEVWSQKLTALLDNSGVMMQCVNKDYEGDIKASGDTVKIRSFGDVDVSTYTGTISSYSELSASSQELVIDQEKIFAFKVGDIATAQSNVDILNGYMERAKVAVDLVKDTYLLGKHADVPAANTLGTDASPIALTKTNIYSYFVNIAKILKKSNAASAGKTPWIVINPDVEAVLMQADQFIHATQAGDNTLRDGSIGKIAGMDVLSSTNLTANNGKFYVMAGTNDAITFASQVANIEKLRDPNSFADLVRGLYLYGAKTVVPEALAKLICTVE